MDRELPSKYCKPKSSCLSESSGKSDRNIQRRFALLVHYRLLK